MKFKGRVTRPRVSEWVEVEAASGDEAVQIIHKQHVYPGSGYSATVKLDNGQRLHLARIQLEGLGESFSRYFWQGIYRAGGVRTPGHGSQQESLETAAREIAYDDAIETLLDDSMWDGTEPR